ncbi:hypothetical protein DAT35_31740 [Vitiosangium sp. GDMCC 1.1324]|nr:hypothetical protein DAT35_31740 [Vitiosangium sp. GDMCC 1.1324]
MWLASTVTPKGVRLVFMPPWRTRTTWERSMAWWRKLSRVTKKFCRSSMFQPEMVTEPSEFLRKVPPSHRSLLTVGSVSRQRPWPTLEQVTSAIGSAALAPSTRVH